MLAVINSLELLYPYVQKLQQPEEMHIKGKGLNVNFG
jgi:hypothetical protein